MGGGWNVGKREKGKNPAFMAAYINADERSQSLLKKINRGRKECTNTADKRQKVCARRCECAQILSHR